MTSTSIAPASFSTAHDAAAAQADQAHMNGDDDQSSNEEEQFFARIASVRDLYRILDALHVKTASTTSAAASDFEHASTQWCVLQIAAAGIELIVDVPQRFQAKTLLKPELFSVWQLPESAREASAAYRFSVNLNTLLECLSMSGAAAQASNAPTSATMHYAPNHNFIVTIDCNNQMLITSQLKIAAPGPQKTDYASLLTMLGGSTAENALIVEAQSLYEALNELDWSAKTVTLTTSPVAPCFRVSSHSDAIGSINIEYERTSDVFTLFNCIAPRTFTYDTSLLQPCIKSLSLCEKSKLRVASNGLLVFQHMIPLPSSKVAYVDFFVVPQDDDDDDADDDGNNDGAGAD